jgi:hypothetical protein
MQTWLEKILSDFEAIEKEITDGDPIGEEFPVWVRNIFLWLLQCAFPKVKIPSEKHLEPRNVGSLVAYKFLYVVAAKEMSANPHPAMQEFAAIMNPALPQFMEVTKRALVAAVDAPINESAEFFHGMGRVFTKRKPRAITARQITLVRTQAVYLCLLMDWQNVPTGITSKQLYDWLDKQLPPEIVGTNPDWIRGICTRIKFPLAPEGRPRKKKRR